jgi:hypothetical protein
MKVPCKYVYAEEFSEGLALVFEYAEDIKAYHSHYINGDGKIVIDLASLNEASKFDMWGTFEFEKGLFSFNDGLAPFVNDENKWGFIDKDGNLVIPCEFDLVGKFSENLAFATIFGKMTGYINKDGSWQITLADERFVNLFDICNCIYSGQPFANGVAVMTVIDRTQICDYYETILINKSGEIIFEKANQIGTFTDTE